MANHKKPQTSQANDFFFFQWLSMYGETQESGLIETIPEVCILTNRANSQSTDCFLFFSILIFPHPRGGAGAGGCSG